MPQLPRPLAALARTLTYILGHRPDEFGLVLDEDGSVAIKSLLATLAAEPGLAWVRRHHLEELAALLVPPRFAVAGDSIRSLDPPPPDLRRPQEAVPTYLYTSVAPKVHARVWEEGLQAPPGKELALARNPELARKMGLRRTPHPVPVKIQAQAAARKGVVLTAYGEELFLAAAVPRAFLELIAPPPAKEKPKPDKPAAPPLPGEIRLDPRALVREGSRPQGRRDEPAWKAATRKERRRRRSQ